MMTVVQWIILWLALSVNIDSFSEAFVNNFRVSRVVENSRGKTTLPFPQLNININRQTIIPLKMSGKDEDYYSGMDFYQILDVERTADTAGIKAAYRKQVIKWHPDKYPDDPEKMKEGSKRMESINKAWNVLKDGQSRAKYDKPVDADAAAVSAASKKKGGKQGGQEIEVKKNTRPIPTPNYEEVDVDGMNIGDIFESLFGGFGEAFGGERVKRGSQSQRHKINTPPPGEDIQVQTEIPFMTSVFGGQHKLIIKRAAGCKKCQATGVKPGAKVKTCEGCRGKGMITRVQRTAFGTYQQTSTCPTCLGAGESVEAVCGDCRGVGTRQEEHELDLRIPAGLEDGATLKVKDGGNEGVRHGPRGDLYVQVKVTEDPNFKRQDHDIISTEEISYLDAILGTTLEVNTVHGKHELKVPKGTQPGTKLTIRGFGVPRVGGLGQRGDAVVTVNVAIPKVVSEKEKTLLEQIKAVKASSEGKPNIVL